MNTALLEALADSWREDAERFREYGAETLATACERHADDLEDSLREWVLEPLTVADAADESGYSERRLRELLSDGTLPNAGRAGAPRIRRCHLPAKSGGEDPTLEVADGGASLADEALERRRS